MAGGTHMTEWFADISFQDSISWTAFQQRWHAQLAGGIENEVTDRLGRALPEATADR